MKMATMNVRERLEQLRHDAFVHACRHCTVQTRKYSLQNVPINFTSVRVCMCRQAYLWHFNWLYLKKLRAPQHYGLSDTMLFYPLGKRQLRNGQDVVLTNCHFLDMASPRWIYVVREMRLIQWTQWTEMPGIGASWRWRQKVRTYHPQYTSSHPKMQPQSFEPPKPIHRYLH